jgi:tight adherence protein C
MTMVQYLLPAMLGVAVISAVLGVMRLRGGDNRVVDRLRKIGTPQGEVVESAAGLFARPLPVWLRPFTVFSWVLPWQSQSPLLRWELAGAGFRHDDVTKVFVGLRVFLAAALGLVMLYVGGNYTGLLQMEVTVLSGVVALVGFMAPSMWLRIKQNQRRMEITLALPDALDLMVICVEAGQGLNAALLSVSRESTLHSRAMSEELRLVNLEMSTGVQRTQALRNLARRTGNEDVRGLVAVLVQSDRFGTSIARALRIHAASLRTRRRQRAEEAARKTPVKMLFPLVFCIFPALLVVMLAPGMLQLIDALKGMND